MEFSFPTHIHYFHDTVRIINSSIEDNMINILFCGDVVGRSGRDAVLKYVPKLRHDLDIHHIILNGENAAHGFGITRGICEEFFKIGVDVITLGNHAFDNKEILRVMNSDAQLVKKMIRPMNYPAHTPGRGYTFIPTRTGHQILVINVMGRIFMDPLDDPFSMVQDLVTKYPLGGQIAGIFVDIHGEASSEKMAFAHYMDGRVSAVVGTHTHTPTADAHIFPLGTGYQTDAGMCGDYNSVIGMDKETPLRRFLKKFPTERMQPASGPGTFCGVLIRINEQGLCAHIEPVRCGPHLMQTHSA